MQLFRATAVAACAMLCVLAGSAQAGPLVPDPLTVEASTTNPLSGCPGDNLGQVYVDSEVEPWVAVNPTNPLNIVGFYQQDRYSNGGSKGNVAAVSTNGGTGWAQTVPPQRTRCTGGPNAIFERASDPWVDFSPNGTLHSMSLVLDPDPPGGGFGDNAMVYNRSTNGGLTWEAPDTLRQDTNPRWLNDKNSLTADPNDSDFVYAVWDRLETPAGEIQSSPQGAENIFGLGFKGPIWFARSTNNGSDWEQARPIYTPPANNQTIGNQIVVEPDTAGELDGTLFNFFNEPLVRPRFRALLSYITSDDHGASWSPKASRVAQLVPMDRVREDGVIDVEGETEGDPCPDPSDANACPIRTADILFDVAVDPVNGNLYAVWQDARFDGFTHDSIAFTQSTNGGQSWSAPIKVNATPESEPVNDQQAFTPSVHVEDGSVTVTYYDFRNNGQGDGVLGTDQWAIHCDGDCSDEASWTGEVRVTPETFDMRIAPFARGYFVGDYEGLASDGIDFISFFSQTHANETSAFFRRLNH